MWGLRPRNHENHGKTAPAIGLTFFICFFLEV